MNQVISILLPACGVAVGLGVLYKAYLDYQAARRSLRWPSVGGSVTEAHMQETQTDSDTDGGRTTAYLPVIFYSYVVDGVTHTSANRVLSGIVPVGFEDARAIVSRHPAGTRVKVYYDPEKPSMAVLEPGIDEQKFQIEGVVGLMFLLVSAHILWRTLSR